MRIALVETLFDTRELEKDLASRSINGAVITLGTRGIGFVIRLASMVVLARLLTPSDFGLVAMALVITGFAALFSDAGLSMAVVQRKNLTHEQASSLFWITLAICCSLCLIVALSAPLVSWVYGDQRLTPLTATLGLTFVLSGLSLMHVALLRRQMRLGSLGLIEVGSQLLGFVASLVAASWGYGYWALVVRLFAIEAARLMLALSTCHWRPGLPHRDVELRSMLFFGGNLTVANLLSYSTSKVDSFLLGVFWGPASLGIYSRAMNLLLLPRTLLIEPLHNVAIPALSRLSDDPDRFARLYRKALMLMLAGMMPLMLFLFVAAEPLIQLVLGDQWGAAVPVFRILSIAGFVQTLDGASGWVNIASGQAERRLKWRMIESPIKVLGIAIGVQWGAVGAAAGFSAVAVLLRVPELRFCLRATPVSLADVARAAWRPMLSSVIAGGVCVFWRGGVDTIPVAALPAIAVLFFGSYLLILVIACGGLKGFSRAFSIGAIRDSLLTRRRAAC